MKGFGAVWKAYGFASVVALALAIGLALYGLFFWMGRATWPLSTDYSYLYTAGKTWAAGLSPYGDAFRATSVQVTGHELVDFAYPPNWWPLAQGLALIDPWVSNVLWFCLSIAFAGGASWIVASLLARYRTSFTPVARAVAPVNPGPMGIAALAGLLAAYVILTKGAGTHALVGQTAMFMLFGQALLALGVLDRKRWPVVIGLVILLLKPNIGIPYGVVLLIPRETRVSALIAGLTTGLLALPGMLPGGPVEALTKFYGGIVAYGGRVENLPDATSGLGNFTYRATGLPVSVLIWLALAIVGALLCWRPMRSLLGTERSTLALLVSTTLAIFLLIPLHDYDFVLIAPLLAFLFFMRGTSLIVGIVGLLLTTRAVEVFERIFAQGGWIEGQRISATAFTVGVVLACVALAVEIRSRALVNVA